SSPSGESGGESRTLEDESRREIPCPARNSAPETPIIFRPLNIATQCLEGLRLVPQLCIVAPTALFLKTVDGSKVRLFAHPQRCDELFGVRQRGRRRHAKQRHLWIDQQALGEGRGHELKRGFFTRRDDGAQKRRLRALRLRINRHAENEIVRDIF